jgi:1,2-phenylacetyl-CoA epoxidase PaaB subunit
MDGALEHIGCLSAPNPEIALSQARLMYSEKIWVEMCMVRRDDVIPIISPNDILGAA